MITRENFDKVLVALGFSQDGAKYFRQYGDDYENRLVADFGVETLSYPPSLSIQRETVTNFSDHENFVTFECVARLLAKGYVPAHIELESPIPGGHGSVIGYNDIRVKDNDGKTFLLIECKTADEFSRFWKQTLFNGSQLFNYFNTYREAEALCLYASDWTKDGGLSYVSHIISMRDNEEYLQTNKELKSFKSVGESKGGGTKDDYFDVWAETYKKEFDTAGVFEEEIEAYSIGKLKYTVRDLIEPKDNSILKKKDYEFATIMRRHNVGSHENAFDKLVNLFLAKIVDESTNADELQFRWRGVANDDYFRLQDRLQKLYKEGMEKFLGEEVTYIDQSEVSDAFHFFKNDPDATRDKILSYFRQLKFFTNSDFAFLDVHNETLFYKNAAILKEMVQMLQDMKLKTNAQNQFLGDLFEHFLDQGVKQNEGQYLTPLPIVKFLVSSLPLAAMMRVGGDVPRAIDYACGAGHFLTEYAEEIKGLAQEIPGVDVKEYNRRTVGIEKEYRLSKVAKVSAFMYGHEEIQIVYGDALAVHENIKDGSFSVLVANPPYSVDGFLETLSETNRANFVLTSRVSDITKNDNIQSFFVERAKQLLRSGGVAAIILPNSVLNNTDNVYTGCREILLQYFHIVAIAAFGGGTFGKTQTETVTLFLRRRDTNPNAAEHYKNRVGAWFHADKSKDEIFDDSSVIDEYCALCKMDAAEYRSWLMGGAVPNAPIFAAYNEAAKKDAKYKQIAKKCITAKYTQTDKDDELVRYVDDFTKNKEKDKLYFFMLANDSPASVVVVRSPDDNKQRKAFIGYEWSDSKESKGIQYIGAEQNLIQNIKTPLFNANDLYDAEKINTLIRNNFEGKKIVVSGILQEYVSVHRLVNLMDFGNVDYKKTISLSPILHLGVKRLYNTEILKNVVNVNLETFNPTGTPQDEYHYVDIGAIDTRTNKIDYSNVVTGKTAPSRARRIAHENDVLISTVRPYLKSFAIVKDIPENTLFSTGFAILSTKDEKRIVNEYIFHLFMNDPILMEQMKAKMGKGAYPSINQNDINNFSILLPSIKVQREIVDKFHYVDTKIQAETVTLEQYNDEVKSKFEEMFGNESTSTVALETLCKIIRGVTFDKNRTVLTKTKNAVLTADNISLQGDFELKKILYVDDSVRFDEEKKLKKGDIFICLSSGSMNHVGKTARIISDTDFYAGGFMGIIRPKEKVSASFLYYALHTVEAKQYFRRNATGMNIKNLSNSIGNMQIIDVPLALQKEFAAFVRAADEKKNAAARRKEELLAKRDRIVDKYFR